MKDEDAQQHCSNGSDACPDGIGDADGDGLCGFRQKHRTQHIEQGKARNPQPILRTNCEFGLAEAESEACFTKTCDDEDDPVHGCKGMKKFRNPSLRPDCGLSKKESTLSQSKRLQILVHRADGADAEVLNQDIGHIGRKESWQGRAKVDVLHTEAEQG